MTGAGGGSSGSSRVDGSRTDAPGPDPASDTRWLTDDEQLTWHAFQHMRTQFAAALRKSMLEECGIPGPYYEVLAVLSDAEGGVLRARDLRFQLQWEKSLLAHRIKKMEAEGLVTRSMCADDPRAPMIAMTEHGRATIRAAAPAHVSRVRDLVFDVLTPAQQHALRDISEALMSRMAERHLTDG